MVDGLREEETRIDGGELALAVQEAQAIDAPVAPCRRVGWPRAAAVPARSTQPSDPRSSDETQCRPGPGAPASRGWSRTCQKWRAQAVPATARGRGRSAARSPRRGWPTIMRRWSTPSPSMLLARGSPITPPPGPEIYIPPRSRPGRPHKKCARPSGPGGRRPARPALLPGTAQSVPRSGRPRR
jgi:hypothetical protein